SGIVFPYVLPGGDHIRECRLRKDHPDLELQPDGRLKEKNKYSSPHIGRKEDDKWKSKSDSRSRRSSRRCVRSYEPTRSWWIASSRGAQHCRRPSAISCWVSIRPSTSAA